MPILGQYLIDLSVSVMVGGSLALFFLAVSVGVLLMDGKAHSGSRGMTYTILTTHTLGGEIEIGFHRKADGTAYAFADLADKNAQLIAQAEANAPKVEFTEDVTASGKEMTITAAAKTLGIGPKKLFDWLRQHKFLYSQSTQAMQTAITRGLMVVRFADITRTDGSKEKKAHAHVTGKGLFYFYQALRKEGLIDRNPILELAA